MKKSATITMFAVAATIVLLSECSFPVPSRQYTYVARTTMGSVTTYAGVVATTGLIGGVTKGQQAMFSSPAGVAVDAAGNVYVADTSTQSIRKITPAGDVSTVTTVGALSSLSGIAADASGRLYAAESGGTISRINASTGLVTPISNSIAVPYAVIANAAGTALYVTDTNNSTVYKLTSPNGFADLATTFTSVLTTSIISPRGMALDSSGSLWVVDQNNKTVYKITGAESGGTTPTSITLSGGTFTNPNGIAVDASGALYVSDDGDQVIRKITMTSSTTGTVTVLAGMSGSPGPTDSVGTNAQFNTPEGVAFNASASALYVADLGNGTIRKLTTSAAGGFAGGAIDLNTTVTTYAGWPLHAGSSDGKALVALFNGPEGICTDPSGNVYVGDILNHAIRKITPNGVVVTVAGSGLVGNADGNGTAASFDAPKCVAFDTTTGNLYVGNAGPNVVRMITPSGDVTTPALDFTAAGVPSFQDTHGIAVDSSGNVYIGDFYLGVFKLTWNGAHSAMIVSALASQYGVRSLALDKLGKVYFADSDPVYKGVYKIVSAGSWVAIKDTTGAPVVLDSFAVAVDNEGNVYGGNGSAILQITPTGTVRTLAGQISLQGSTDGIGSDARFNLNPSSYAFDPSGNLYVADLGNNTIRKITVTNKPVL